MKMYLDESFAEDFEEPKEDDVKVTIDVVNKDDLDMYGF